VIPGGGETTMTDYDELLARADKRLRPEGRIGWLHMEGDFKLIADLEKALRAALATRPQVDAGPWPKFCPWCAAEFNADGTVTAPEVLAPSATPTEEEDNIGRRLSDFGEHLLERGSVAGSATPTGDDDE